MSKQLPPKPNLEQLKKQAKDLRKAHQAGDAEAIARIREHLPRLSGASDEEIRQADVSLTEIQHVIAGEYEFRNWNWLHAVVEIDLDLLSRLTDREIQTLMRETDYKDLVVSLKGASEVAKEKFLRNMSERVRTFIVEEMEFLGPMPQTEIEEVQGRVMMQAAQLAARGQIDWPNNGPASPPEKDAPVFTHSERLLELAGKALEALGLDEVVALWWELAEQARREGILSLEPVAEQTEDPFVKEALRLAVDGTEPDLIEDILETRSQRAVLSQQETRGRMVVEALMSILSGDNPLLTYHKLSTFYQAIPSGEETGSMELSVEQLQAGLRESLGGTPFSRMEFEQISELFKDMGELARRAGIEALRPLVEVIDGSLLKRGLEMAVNRVEPDQVMDELESQLKEELQQAEARHRAVIAGIEATQGGRTPEEVKEAARRAAQEVTRK